jgi:anti-sigma regulatory factor (Ser/Thr protein kinase)
MDSNARIETQLPRDLRASSHARRLLDEHYRAALDSRELDTAKLLTTELVNNAVLHGRGKITLRSALDEDRLLIEVIDEGSGFERVLGQRDFNTVGGLGLYVVEAAASRWGVHEGTTHVWFELERPGPRIGVDSKPKPDE